VAGKWPFSCRVFLPVSDFLVGLSSGPPKGRPERLAVDLFVCPDDGGKLGSGRWFRKPSRFEPVRGGMT
jgi:hypothetical protein